MVAVDADRVLQPKDPSITDSNQWPIFCLRKVNVVAQDNNAPISLLAANQTCPVKVSGILQQPSPELEYLVKDKKYISNNQRIELPNVTMYAFAEFSDGTYGFWAAGSAGWFEVLDPLASFSNVYGQMREAASMFYALADKQRKSRKKNAQMSVKELDIYVRGLFKEYVSRDDKGNPLRRMGADDAREGFHGHAQFIITSMLEGQECADWGNSPYLRYYKAQFPGQYANILRRLRRNSRIPQDLRKLPKRRERPKREMSSKPPTVEEPAKPHGGRRSGRRTVTNGPHTPVKSTVQLDEVVSSGDENYDKDGNLLEARYPNNKRKCTSILQPKGSKFSKKAASRRRSRGSRTSDANDSEPSESNDFDERFPFPENSPLAAVAKPDVLDPSLQAQNIGAIKVIPYEIPSDRPQGPGDLWTCSFENCEHRVHECSKPKGKARIKEHFQLHAQQAQEKIDLALTESRPYLPVSNLVRQIQQLQCSHPTPIRQRY